MRAWVTGTGIVSCLGLTAEATFTKLLTGERGLGPIDVFDTVDQRARIGGQVRGVPVPKGDEWSRSSAFALVAAKEALAGAGVDPKHERVGLVVGGTTAGMFEDELRVARMISREEPRRPIREMRCHPLSSTLDALDGEIGPFCRLRTVASACSSGTSALWVALAWLLTDPTIDAVLAGGTDGLCRLTVTGFNALAAMDPEPCRPFDRARRGMNLGEGAGFVVVERSERVLSRGKRPIAELASVVVGAEAHHITNPEPTGERAGRIIARALEKARVSPRDVDYVNAHGTATPLNDAMEAKALRYALGSEVERVPVSSSKAQIGHTLGAAGAIEAVISAFALDRAALPPTAGLTDPDPECPLVHVRETRKVARVRAVVSTSFGFGGMDAALVLTEPELAPESPGTVARVVVTGGAALGPRGVSPSSSAPSLTTGAQASGRIADVTATLDPARARRLDRAGRLATIVAQAALGEAVVAPESRAAFGVILGSAFSAVDDCGAFMRRILDKGPRLASPADFPNLVPSSPIGHASIYLGLGGAAMATAELHASGESAVATAFEAIAAREATSIVAGACPVAAELIDEVFAPLFDDGTESGARSEGSAALVLESEESALARGAKAIATVAHVAVTRGESPELPAPASLSRARVVGRTAKVAAHAGGAWRDVARVDVEPGFGDNDAAGACAMVAALGLLRSGDVDEVLVVGSRPGPGVASSRYFMVLRRA